MISMARRIPSGRAAEPATGAVARGQDVRARCWRCTVLDARQSTVIPLIWGERVNLIATLRPHFTRTSPGCEPCVADPRNHPGEIWGFRAFRPIGAGRFGAHPCHAQVLCAPERGGPLPGEPMHSRTQTRTRTLASDVVLALHAAPSSACVATAPTPVSVPVPETLDDSAAVQPSPCIVGPAEETAPAVRKAQPSVADRQLQPEAHSATTGPSVGAGAHRQSRVTPDIAPWSPRSEKVLELPKPDVTFQLEGMAV